jgi:hypothetical protein
VTWPLKESKRFVGITSALFTISSTTEFAIALQKQVNFGSSAGDPLQAMSAALIAADSRDALSDT